MTITIHIPAPLRPYCEDASELFLSAPTVRAVLEQLDQSHPSLYRSICDETGSVRRHVNLFVNTSNVRDREGLNTALANIWSLEAGDDKKDLWCGVEPASFFRSSDGGEDWSCLFNSLPPIHCVKVSVV